MHTIIAFLIALFLSVTIAVGLLFVGYYAYRARRARERLGAETPVIQQDQADPLDEYRRLGQEIQESLQRGRETAIRMRDTVERGVR